MRRIDEIIVHCSATKEGKNFTIEDIDRWHRERGWNGCGYHYVIHLDGSVHPGRPESVVGAHATSHNSHSIGVCYVGGLDAGGRPKDTRTSLQKTALVRLLRDLKSRYVSAKLIGHCDCAKKDCPCFNVSEEYKNL